MLNYDSRYHWSFATLRVSPDLPVAASRSEYHATNSVQAHNYTCADRLDVLTVLAVCYHRLDRHDSISGWPAYVRLLVADTIRLYECPVLVTHVVMLNWDLCRVLMILPV